MFNFSKMEAEADGNISDGIRAEKHALKFFRSSVAHWEAIIQDLNKTIEETKTENEWKARYVGIHFFQYDSKTNRIERLTKKRYDNQFAYNQMQRNQLTTMKYEISVMRRCLLSKKTYPKIENLSHAECQGLIKRINFERFSLKGLIDMYERKLNTEATAHNHIREMCEDIAKDVRFQQTNVIKEQEKLDHLVVKAMRQRRLSYDPAGKIPILKIVKRNMVILKPLTNSYAQRHVAKRQYQENLTVSRERDEENPRSEDT